MNMPSRMISLHVDPSNPGEFFASCGLLELADRLWHGAEGWFDEGEFCIAPTEDGEGGTLERLLSAVQLSVLEPLDRDDDMTTPLQFNDLFGRLTLDWWRDEQSKQKGSDLKTWAGQQKVVRIATALQAVLSDPGLATKRLFDHAAVLFDTRERSKTVEPFYFDDRRAAQAQTLDIGFSPDAQGMTMPVFSPVEFFCLVGLKRFRPTPIPEARTFEYCTWSFPLVPPVARLVAAGLMANETVQRYSFRLLYRTKYLKGFLPATPTR
jgi:CRISPR-associated protein Csx14